MWTRMDTWLSRQFRAERKLKEHKDRLADNECKGDCGCCCKCCPCKEECKHADRSRD